MWTGMSRSWRCYVGDDGGDDDAQHMMALRVYEASMQVKAVIGGGGDVQVRPCASTPVNHSPIQNTLSGQARRGNIPPPPGERTLR
jgi:hypothetical protein